MVQLVTEVQQVREVHKVPLEKKDLKAHGDQEVQKDFQEKMGRMENKETAAPGD